MTIYIEQNYYLLGDIRFPKSKYSLGDVMTYAKKVILFHEKHSI